MAPTSPQDASDAHAPLGVQASLESLADELDANLAEADRALRDGYPGERSGRQPVHTVYVPADRYSERLVPDWGAAALAALDADPDGFRAVLGGRATAGSRSGCAPSWPPSRSRTCGSTSRTATATDQ